MPDFEINIKTTADVAGSEKSAASLDNLKQKAGASGEALSSAAVATKELGAKTEETKQHIDEHGKSLEEGKKHTELFGEAHHEAHAAVKALGEILPGVGQLAREMYSVQTVGIGLVSIGVGMLIEHFEKLSEEQKAFVEGAAKGVGSMLLAQAGAAAAAAAEHQHLADALAHASTGESSMLTAMSNRIALFDKYIEGLKKVESAEDKAEEARIKRAQREGKISPDQAEAGIAAIHGRAESRNAAHDDEAAQFKLDQETAALKKAQQDLPALTQAKEAAAAKVKTAESAQKSAETRAGTGEGSEAEQLKQRQEELNRKQAELDDLKRYQSGATGGDSIPGSIGSNFKDLIRGTLSPITGAGGKKDFEAKEEAVKEAEQARDQQAKAVKEAKDEAARKAAESQAARDAAEEVNKKYTEAQSTVNQYGGFDGKVSVDAAKLAQDRAANAAVTGIKNRSDTEGAAADAAFQDPLEGEAATMRQHAQGILDQSRNVQPGSHAAHQTIQELTVLIRHLTGELAKFTRGGIPDDQGLGAEIKELRKEVENLQGMTTARGSRY